MPFDAIMGPGIIQPEGRQPSLLHWLSVWLSTRIFESKATSKRSACIKRSEEIGYGLSLAINVVAQTTTYDSPWTGISTPIPMECKWVIVLLPASETFSTAKAFDIVSGIPTRVEEEAGFGEGVRCSNKVGRVGPFEGYGTLRC